MADAFLLLIRWIHIIAAAIWVGGGIFYWVVVMPAVRGEGIPDSTRRFMGSEFGQVVTLCMWALVITGGILAFTQLSQAGATTAYGAVLAAKVALSAWMFFVALNRGRRATAASPNFAGKARATLRALGHINMTVVLGLIVFFLSEVLRYIIDRA
ncbi:MAG: CopD family protein [Dehalococcoidia bacterium]